MSNYDVVNPDPSALVQSMRAIGYELTTALADIIDNSISAGAGEIHIHALWDGEDSYLMIEDNGSGMTETSLIEAMRPGTIRASEERGEDDLGRFGLGLKTASFSQCKKLSVVTKHPVSGIHSRMWDLDLISSTKEWRLLEADGSGAADMAGSMLKNRQSGTVVVWESMDRWVGGMSKDSPRDHRKFLEDLEKIEDHLSMIFHRFIEPPNPIHLSINGNPIPAWDPFLKKETFTQYLPPEELMSGESAVKVRPYVLPHHSHIKTAVHERAAGIKGWNAQQGFYLYRNKRMLMAGDWLGLGMQKEEHYKLARIQVDLPNSLDANWSLDIKKSRITVPVEIREDLKRIAGLTRSRASEVYRYRGKIAARTTGEAATFIWERRMNRGAISYRINRQAPLIKTLLVSPDRQKVLMAFSLIEETIPIDTIIIDNSTHPSAHSTGYHDASEGTIKQAIEDVYGILLEGGHKPEDALNILKTMEPFHRDPRAVAIIEEIR